MVLKALFLRDKEVRYIQEKGGYFPIIPCDNITEYLETGRILYREFQGRMVSFWARHLKPAPSGFPLFRLEDLIVKEIKDSYHADNRLDAKRKSGITRRDILLSDDTGSLIAYLNLTERTDPKIWSQVLFSQRGDIVNVWLGMPPTSDYPHAGLYKLENQTLLERVRPSISIHNANFMR